MQLSFLCRRQRSAAASATATAAAVCAAAAQDETSAKDTHTVDGHADLLLSTDAASGDSLREWEKRWCKVMRVQRALLGRASAAAANWRRTHAQLIFLGIIKHNHSPLLPGMHSEHSAGEQRSYPHLVPAINCPHLPSAAEFTYPDGCCPACCLVQANLAASKAGLRGKRGWSSTDKVNSPTIGSQKPSTRHQH